MKKRIAALLLSLLMIVSMAGCQGKKKPKGEVKDLSDGGIMLTVPKEFKDAKGVITYYSGALNCTEGVFYSFVFYVGAEIDEYNSIMDPANPTDEHPTRFEEVWRTPVMIICADEEITKDEAAAAFMELSLDINPDDLEKIGKNEGFDYYLVLDKDTSRDALLGDFAEEYRALCNKDLIVSSIDFVYPEATSIAASQGRLEFETTDVYGNKVTSAELFSKNKVTMVNIWASWCGPCVREMPELEKLGAEFAKNGCGIIGVLTDGNEKEGLADGLEILKETGVTYPVIKPWSSFESELHFTAVPTTYFVDSEGNILQVKPVVGAYIEEYKQAMDQALEIVGQN